MPKFTHPDFASMDTLLLHADAHLESGPAVAPPLHLSTTFAADNPDGYVYARNHTVTRSRLEAVLGALEGGQALCFASGLAAAYAALRHFRPARVAIDRGYHGTHNILSRLQSEGVQLTGLDADPREGDLFWLETPKNPTCEIEDIQAISQRVHAGGGHVLVDSTFATPVLQNPLQLGADMVMHSATKYIGGHSDLLAGVLVCTDPARVEDLTALRAYSGGVPGALETWLALRSLRTLRLRVLRQSESATTLAAWLEGRLPRVWHPSLPSHPGYAIAQAQMRGPGGVLSMELESEAAARSLPGQLKLFTEATSLGRVESLIEWRRRHDQQAAPALLRLSIGLEDPADLIADLEAGLQAVGNRP